MPGPGCLAVLGARVHADGTAVVRFGAAHPYLEVQGAALGQRQGRAEDKLVQGAAADAVAGGEGRVRRAPRPAAGGAEDDVVGRPGGRVRGEAVR
ncbi:hypothetical protein LT493_43765 [Streptomyces tricolor]|nr:hypothetical protein [Streptomyces tricolor]